MDWRTNIIHLQMSILQNSKLAHIFCIIEYSVIYSEIKKESISISEFAVAADYAY